MHRRRRCVDQEAPAGSLRQASPPSRQDRLPGERPRGRHVRVPEKRTSRLRAVAYPRRGEFCSENGGEGPPQMGGPKGEIHSDRTRHSGATKSSNQKKLTRRRSRTCSTENPEATRAKSCRAGRRSSSAGREL